MSLARLNVYWTVSQARERPKTFTPVELSVSLILSTFYLLSVPFNNSKKKLRKTQVRLLQLQWDSRGDLAGANMELALPDTARLLR